MDAFLQAKTILITGGTGSVGSELTRQILRQDPAAVRVLSRDEHKQFMMAAQLRHDPRVRFLIGDVREKSRLRCAMDGVDIVFHTAALKQVPACEYNPFEAVQTNIFGVKNVAETALECGVERVVNVSTDKAVNPSSVMGASKMMAERLFASVHRYRGPRPTRFITVRLGNVIASRGSVVPLFWQQAASSGFITLTDPRMTRFFMQIEDAVSLILKATEMARDGSIWVLKMPCVHVVDVAEVICDIAQEVLDLKDVTIKQVGIRPGEKLHEELVSTVELPFCYDLGEVFCIDPFAEIDMRYTDTPLLSSPYSSSQGPFLAHADIDKLLRPIIIKPSTHAAIQEGERR